MGRPTKIDKLDVRTDIRLPADTNTFVDAEVERTGIPKAILLRSIIIDWVREKRGT